MKIRPEKTVGHVNELVTVWSETTITFNKDVTSLILRKQGKLRMT